MFGLIFAAAVYSCQVYIPTPQSVSVKVYYQHEDQDGRAYTYRALQFLDTGSYDVVPEGHPCGVQWSSGTFCGVLPDLVFRDGFESNSTGKWSNGGS